MNLSASTTHSANLYIHFPFSLNKPTCLQLNCVLLICLSYYFVWSYEHQIMSIDSFVKLCFDFQIALWLTTSGHYHGAKRTE